MQYNFCNTRTILFAFRLNRFISGKTFAHANIIRYNGCKEFVDARAYEETYKIIQAQLTPRIGSIKNVINRFTNGKTDKIITEKGF